MGCGFGTVFKKLARDSSNCSFNSGRLWFLRTVYESTLPSSNHDAAIYPTPSIRNKKSFARSPIFMSASQSAPTPTCIPHLLRVLDVVEPAFLDRLVIPREPLRFLQHEHPSRHVHRASPRLASPVQTRHRAITHISEPAELLRLTPLPRFHHRDRPRLQRPAAKRLQTLLQRQRPVNRGFVLPTSQSRGDPTERRRRPRRRAATPTRKRESPPRRRDPAKDTPACGAASCADSLGIRTAGIATRGGEIRLGEEEVGGENAVESRVFDSVERSAGGLEGKGEAGHAGERRARRLKRREELRFVGAVEKHDNRGTGVKRGAQTNPFQRTM